ncbi:MAG: VWA domain-containing protein [Alphaproteobacteria bacterium]|nr:VWA domain-containing protein [Alphaproteobacteria bacterium]
MSNKDVVDIVVLIDKSASMGGMEEETIGAFNAFLKEQKQVDGNALLTLVLFDHEKECLHFREHLENIENLTTNTYSVRGNTSLYDCIGSVIETMLFSTKSNNVIFLIQSDGQENTSKLYSSSHVTRLIKDCEKLGWEFQFIGTGIDAIAEGSKFGMKATACLSVAKSDIGFQEYSTTIDCCTKAYRAKQA